jgi:hypothetical protein
MTQSNQLSPVQKNKLGELISAVYGMTDTEAVLYKMGELFRAKCQTEIANATYQQGALLTGMLLSELRAKTNTTSAANLPPPVKTNAPHAEPAPATTSPEPQMPNPSPAATNVQAPQAMTQIISGEASFSWNALTVDINGWEEQWTARGATGDEIIKRVSALKAHLIEKGYKPVTRRQNSPRGETSASEPNAEDAPLCAIHKKPMEKRQGKNGMFWSCHSKLEDGTWCPYKPPKK